MRSSTQTTMVIAARYGWYYLAAASWLHSMVVMTATSLPTPIPPAAATTTVPRIAVVGGGASGIFASIAAAEAWKSSNGGTQNGVGGGSHTTKMTTRCEVCVLEGTAKTLAKVQISGGGRCNVMHDARKPVATLLQNYPRGQQELNGLFHKRFGPLQIQDWFETRGVTLKTESDGRMFPITDSSQTVMDVLLRSAAQAHVKIRTRCQVQSITALAAEEEESPQRRFAITIRSKSDAAASTTVVEYFDGVILATGSAPVGYQLAQSLGHTIVPTVPSLFTLSTGPAVQPGGVLYGLSGVSVPWAKVSWSEPPEAATSSTTPVNPDAASSTTPSSSENKKPKRRGKAVPYAQEGPLLITHHGLTGPAALRLSAFAARELASARYRGRLRVQWIVPPPPHVVALNGSSGSGSSSTAPIPTTVETMTEQLWTVTRTNPKKTISTACPFWEGTIPRRLWASLVQAAGIAPDTIWGATSKAAVRQLAVQLLDCPLELTGKGTFKEEFVTAGGVALPEIDMTRMHSKTCPGLFLCGELINVDGVTGGFNFMNAWGTGYVAGQAAAAYVVDQLQQQQRRSL